jgi:hypothetical protein
MAQVIVEVHNEEVFRHTRIWVIKFRRKDISGTIASNLQE